MDFYIYDDEEFFASDFRNEELQTILDALRKEVKGEILYEMERLKKENEKLQSIKNDMEKIKKEHEKALNDLALAKLDADREAKKNRVSDLLVDVCPIAYKVVKEGVKKEKCDKCDDRRMLNFTSPLGKPMKERCDCDIQDTLYKIKQLALYEIRTDGKDVSFKYIVTPTSGNVDIFQLVEQTDDSDFFKSSGIIRSKSMIGANINTYSQFFATEDLAKAYIDLCTVKELAVKYYTEGKV